MPSLDDLISLSLRDVELIRAERGIVVSYETTHSARLSPTACAAGQDQEIPAERIQNPEFCAVKEGCDKGKGVIMDLQL